MLSALRIKNLALVADFTQLLDRKARIAELTRMLGGRTDAARKHAEALLNGWGQRGQR